jgi:hypothetical protein
MKVILRPENETIQVNESEPFNEFESSVSASPRIGECLRIEGKGSYRITNISHDLSIFDKETYSIGETILYTEKEE